MANNLFYPGMPVGWTTRHHELGTPDPKPTANEFHGPRRDAVFNNELMEWQARQAFARHPKHETPPFSLLARPDTAKGQAVEAMPNIQGIDAQTAALRLQAQPLHDELVYQHNKTKAKRQNKLSEAFGLPANATAAAPKGTKGKLPKGVLTAIRHEYGDPTLSADKASEIWHAYRAKQKYPGLSSFVQGQKGADPASFQTFYAQAIQPYLQQASDQYTSGANAGYDAMAKILSSSAMPQAERTVMQANLPLQRADTQMVGATLASQAASAPITSSILNQLQSMIDEQQQARYYQNQLIASGGQGTATGNDSSTALLQSILNG